MRFVVWLALLAFLPGCATPGSQEAAEVPAPFVAEPQVDVWDGRASILVAKQDWNAGTFALDVLCVFGGAWYVPRTGEAVLNGTAAFNVTVRTGPLYTGLEVGLQFMDEEIQWLPAVRGDQRVFNVPVRSEQWEAPDDHDWTFWYRDTVADNRELCYSGVSLGERSVAIEAIKG